MCHQYACKSGRQKYPYPLIFRGLHILCKKQVKSCNDKRVEGHPADTAQYNAIHQGYSHPASVQDTSRHGRNVITRHSSKRIKGDKYCRYIDAPQVYLVGFLQRKSNQPQQRREIHKNIAIEDRYRIAISVQPAGLDSNRELKSPPPIFV